MSKKNFSRFENEIDEMITRVEKSINSINFDQLGRDINHTVNKTMNQAVREAKRVWDKKEQIGQKMDDFGDQVEDRMRQTVDQTRRWKERRKQQEYTRNPYQNQTRRTKFYTQDRKRNVQRERREGHPRVQKASFPVATVPYGSISGVLYKIIGGIGIGSFGIVFITEFMYMMTSSNYSAISAMMCLFFTIISTFLFCRGVSQRRRVRRFNEYVKIMNGKNHYPVERLAAYAGKDKNYIVKDLNKMVKKRMFLEGHLDQSKTDFILDHQTYELYLNSLNSKRQRELEVQWKEEKLQQEKEAAIAKEGESQSDKIEKVFCEGEIYIKKIRESKDKIYEKEVSEKLDHLENVTHKIFEHIRKYPNKVDKIEKFMEYYLPTTLKLVSTYQELETQPVEGENIKRIKNEIESTLGTINIAFEKLLDGLFEDEMFDISSDISVLETVLKQEGLAESDFNLKDATYEKMREE